MDERDFSAVQLHGTLVNFFSPDDVESVGRVIALVKEQLWSREGGGELGREGIPRCMLPILDGVLSVFIGI